MDAAKRRTNACSFLDEGNPAVKITAAEKNVIE
jgi:hypothetical protein